MDLFIDLLALRFVFITCFPSVLFINLLSFCFISLYISSSSSSSSLGSRCVQCLCVNFSPAVLWSFKTSPYQLCIRYINHVIYLISQPSQRSHTPLGMPCLLTSWKTAACQGFLSYPLKRNLRSTFGNRP